MSTNQEGFFAVLPKRLEQLALNLGIFFPGVFGLQRPRGLADWVLQRVDSEVRRLGPFRARGPPFVNAQHQEQHIEDTNNRFSSQIKHPRNKNEWANESTEQDRDKERAQ